MPTADCECQCPPLEKTVSATEDRGDPESEQICLGNQLYIITHQDVCRKEKIRLYSYAKIDACGNLIPVQGLPKDAEATDLLSLPTCPVGTQGQCCCQQAQLLSRKCQKKSQRSCCGQPQDSCCGQQQCGCCEKQQQCCVQSQPTCYMVSQPCCVPSQPCCVPSQPCCVQPCCMPCKPKRQKCCGTPTLVCCSSSGSGCGSGCGCKDSCNSLVCSNLPAYPRDCRRVCPPDQRTKNVYSFYNVGKNRGGCQDCCCCCPKPKRNRCFCCPPPYCDDDDDSSDCDDIKNMFDGAREQEDLLIKQLEFARATFPPGYCDWNIPRGGCCSYKHGHEKINIPVYHGPCMEDDDCCCCCCSSSCCDSCDCECASMCNNFGLDFQKSPQSNLSYSLIRIRSRSRFDEDDYDQKCNNNIKSRCDCCKSSGGLARGRPNNRSRNEFKRMNIEPKINNDSCPCSIEERMSAKKVQISSCCDCSQESSGYSECCQSSSLESDNMKSDCCCDNHNHDRSAKESI